MESLRVSPQLRPSLGYVTVPRALSLAQVNALIEMGDALNPSPDEGRTASGELPPPGHRRASVAWIFPTKKASWLFEEISRLAQSVNDSAFGFDLFGLETPLQFTKYDPPHGHFTWHRDTNERFSPPRKLSLSIQLSDLTDYQGGDLQLQLSGGAEPKTMSRQRGDAIFFPSETLHRVTPVTSGVRRSLVAFIAGYNE